MNRQRLAVLLAMGNAAMLLNRSPVSINPVHDGILGLVVIQLSDVHPSDGAIKTVAVT